MFDIPLDLAGVLASIQVFIFHAVSVHLMYAVDTFIKHDNNSRSMRSADAFKIIFDAVRHYVDVLTYVFTYTILTYAADAF